MNRIYLIYLVVTIFAAVHALRLELLRKNSGATVSLFYHVLMANMVFFPVVNLVFAVSGLIEIILETLTFLFSLLVTLLRFIFRR